MGGIWASMSEPHISEYMLKRVPSVCVHNKISRATYFMPQGFLDVNLSVAVAIDISCTRKFGKITDVPNEVHFIPHVLGKAN